MLNLASDVCLLHQPLDVSCLAPVSHSRNIVDLADDKVARLFLDGEIDLGRSAASDCKVCDGVLVVELLSSC